MFAVMASNIHWALDAQWLSSWHTRLDRRAVSDFGLNGLGDFLRGRKRSAP